MISLKKKDSLTDFVLFGKFVLFWCERLQIALPFFKGKKIIGWPFYSESHSNNKNI